MYCPVHPHMCGEHSTIPATLVFLDGSSPRVWGTFVATGCYLSPDRLIPTRVGNTTVPNHPQMSRAVHPHTRGEHSRSGFSNS